MSDPCFSAGLVDFNEGLKVLLVGVGKVNARLRVHGATRQNVDAYRRYGSYLRSLHIGGDKFPENRAEQERLAQSWLGSVVRVSPADIEVATAAILSGFRGE